MSYEIRFYLEQRKDRVNDVPIRFSFNFGGQRFMSTTGIKADVKQWSKSKQQILSGATNSEAKNEALKTIRNQLERIFEGDVYLTLLLILSYISVYTF